MASKNKYPDEASVLEIIRTREEMGLPLSPGRLNKGKYPDPDLHKAGIRHCGTWKKAVEAAGFGYAEILEKSRSRYLIAESVIREIQDRHKNGLPLSFVEVGRHSGPNRDLQLYAAATRFFGKWVAAVEAAGLDYSKIRPSRKRRYPDRDAVVEAIRQRVASDLPLNGLAVAKGEHKDSMLYIYGQEYFGGWDTALEAAGISPEEVRYKYQRRYPDAASVVAGIQRRNAVGLPIIGTGIVRGKLSEVGLYQRGKEYFGSWNKAVEAAGFDYSRLITESRRTYPWKETVIKEIHRRQEAGLTLSSTPLMKGEPGEKDRALLHSGTELFGTWRAAIEAAGLDYGKIRKRRSRKYPDEETVLAEIRLRKTFGQPLNTSAL